MEKIILSFKDVTYWGHQDGVDRKIIDNISFNLLSNQINTLIGPNGAGKSTILKLMMNLIKPTSGSITKDKNLTIGYMPQSVKPNPYLPINVKDFLKLYGQSDEHLLHLLNVDKILNHSLHSLSNGEMQRVQFARTLMNNPKLLILDEPTQGVDISGQSDFYEILLGVKARLECSIFIVSHDLHYVLSATDHVICLNRHICCSGKPEEVAGHAEYQRLFGGPIQPFQVAPYQHHHDHDHCNDV